MPGENGLSGEFVISERIPQGTPEPSHKKSVHFYSSLGINPDNVVFENQEGDEEIMLLVRRDLITNVPWILTALILIFIPPLLFLFNDLFSPFFQIAIQTQVVSVLFYYLVVAGFILVEFTIWYFNVGLVTNKRIIDLDVSGILFKHASETKINLIEDVSYSQVGAVRSVFNYGDVLVQTAATQANFEFDRAPEPARIVQIIAEMIGRKPLK
ncbi:MAG: hypothetical protein A3C30_03950 [Candidatus Levybacteria bacterium RIFCSPHIGHO2_02_FULL_40_18]|nr:MAG: hypothetical protein A2869_00570 [Candidatus Levybacteria bacterium RIFCSPHIGHO2_01_FULL_40_58]OGH26237.1 MAG: hypothetical protein A3C30_03950 [Candidatus Levybacteria bacterium RIFCSPHIGHO2_02_FULL_40_18]OGH31489.1 MAG: hypothetical protein A3E43_02990 [Candidatus Levybacteria bacterium RIFCSPHIGHO2_12_FULL_40_31]OGH40129.1 MAG: hypothetical protein A2894_04310 [Candidatus Levybacteria bacterium RIFCSPLOWO2_01_FULL_40_64]OGH49082.1 MAG: hypothetical protein A3I54_00735 [Candidatus Lev